MFVKYIVLAVFAAYDHFYYKRVGPVSFLSQCFVDLAVVQVFVGIVLVFRECWEFFRSMYSFV